jgi:hypothetical protein
VASPFDRQAKRERHDALVARILETEAGLDSVHAEFMRGALEGASMSYLAPLLALILLGARTAPGPVAAQPNGPRQGQGVQSGQVLSLGEILDSVRRQHPGNLADVQGPNTGPLGEPRYRLKWVSPDGRVQWLDIDARTGRVLGVQGAGPDRDPGAYSNTGGVRRGGIVSRRQNLG